MTWRPEGQPIARADRQGAPNPAAAAPVPRTPGAPAAPTPPAADAPLAFIVRGEALRASAESRLRPDPARIAAGWDRRFAIEKRRGEELAKLYLQLGFEVALDAVAPELLEDECAGCRFVMQMEFVQIYTRRP